MANLLEKLFTVGEHPLTLAGLEGVSVCPEAYDPNMMAVLCHPHSLFGGTMNNKVITTIARTFRELGIASLRFNMRGVGKSIGEFDKGIGESEDLRAIVEEMRQQQPDLKIYLIGFSFGSYVAYRVADLADLLVSVAPPVSNFDFATLPLPTCRWLVLQGEADEVTSPEQVFAWLESLPHPPEIIRFPQTSHFFHGKLVDLKNALLSALT